MSLTKEEILDAISEMAVVDVVKLIAMMEEKFGVSAVAPVTPTISDSPKDIIEEKTEFDVLLTNIGSNKISVIKSVRSVIGLGLKDAKDLVESAPVILKESINKEDAELLKKTLEDSGATVEIK